MGRFTLRLPETLHQQLDEQAQLEGVSLNQYIVYALTRQVTPSFTIQFLPEESVQKQHQHYQELLNSLGKASEKQAVANLAKREMAGSEERVPDEMIARIEAKISTTQKGR